jgi:hypothetical protein
MYSVVLQQLGRSMQPVASSVLLTMKEELAAFASAHLNRMMRSAS